jgi:hypothetical protein
MRTQTKQAPRRSTKSVIDVWRVRDQDGISFFDDDFTDVIEVLRKMKDGNEFIIRKEKVKKTDFDEAPDFDENHLEEDVFVPDYFWEEER